MTSGINMSFEFGGAKRDGPSPEPVESGELFRVLVLGDFSGRASRLHEQLAAPSFAPVTVDLDRFDAVLQGLSVALDLRLPQSPDVPVRIRLSSFDDFEPDALFAQLPLFAKLRDLRKRLADPATFEQAAADMRADDAAVTSVGGSAALDGPAGAEDDATTLHRLLGAAPIAAEPAQRGPPGGVDAAVDRLLRRVVAPFVVPATSHLQQPMIESIDRAISETMCGILRNPHWRALEGNWRALDQFTRTVEMDGQVLLELVDASAADVLSSLSTAEGDTARTPLAKKLAARRLHEGQEEGYAVLVAMYEFGPSAAELALLAGLGALAAGEGAVLLGAAAAELALVDAPDAWDGAVPMLTDSQAQARWRAMRTSWVAPHIGLVWPNVMARLPYGAKTQPVSSFAFEELGATAVQSELPWRCAALDLASLLARTFTEAGWDMQSRLAVELEDLPAFVDDRGDSPHLQAVAELYMSQRQAQAVAAAGIMPLISHRTLPHARLATWRSIGAAEPELKARWQA